MCLPGVLQPNSSSEIDTQNQPMHNHAVQYSSVPELCEPAYKSASETPRHDTSSLTDSGCFKSPPNEIPSFSIMDDFDALLLQLKFLGHMELAISKSPNIERQHTVPYFPPVTSALRKERGTFNCVQPSCVEYTDDEALPSPQFFQMSSIDRECVSSLADNSNSASVTDLQVPFQILSDSFLKQFCSQSCPDVSDPAAVAILRASTASIQQLSSPNNVCFNG